MGKLKLMTIVGTRPEIIRLSATIKCCDRYFEQILVHTGQNYDYTLNQVFFDDLGLRAPDYYLDAVGDDLGATIGNIIERSYKLMVQVKPDAVLVLGDTNSCLSVIGAKRLHIPIFHMEAGNRCKDECLPEETNRRIVDIISDVNLCYSEHARRYLMECGMPKERTFVVGSPMAEVLHQNLAEIEKSDILEKLGIDYEMRIISAHREPDVFFEYAKTAEEKGFKVIIAGAGMAAHLPGMCAAIFPMPVIGIPMSGKNLEGVDALYSIVQMPPGIPVATVAIDGGANAAILAAKILATSDPELLQKLKDYTAEMKETVQKKAEKLEKIGHKEYIKQM